MTRDEAAKRLDGGEYGAEGSKELFAEMKAAGLVAVFGASDDLCEFRGAIDDEEGAGEDTLIYLAAEGLLKNECDEDGCPHFSRLKDSAPTIRAIWDREGFSWVYETDIPHATFVIKEDDETYCRGIVFALADVSSGQPKADASEAEAGWQPITTAPKDGADVLLWAAAWEDTWGIQMGRFDGGEWLTGEGSVAENDPDFDPDAEVGEDFDPDDDSNIGPTHWHQLPALPTRFA